METDKSVPAPLRTTTQVFSKELFGNLSATSLQDGGMTSLQDGGMTSLQDGGITSLQNDSMTNMLDGSSVFDEESEHTSYVTELENTLCGDYEPLDQLLRICKQQIVMPFENLLDV
jgi:hypothetical protein